MILLVRRFIWHFVSYQKVQYSVPSLQQLLGDKIYVCYTDEVGQER